MNLPKFADKKQIEKMGEGKGWLGDVTIKKVNVFQCECIGRKKTCIK